VHHVVLERWSRKSSILQRRDARIKIVALLAFLVCVATLPAVDSWATAGFVMFLAAGLLLSKLPVGGVLLRAGVVLPFSGTFALISALSGDPARAATVLVKSYLSALAVLLVVGSTPLPELLRGFEKLGAPRMVTLVVQFLYRYLFVISEQGQHMRQAARCRGQLKSRRKMRRKGFQAAAGALAVLFGRSYQRAESIHRAMLARGFEGRFHPLSVPALRAVDFLFLLIAAGTPVAVRLGFGA
jgi:cobalt/nickel transport system permease protein